MAIEINVPDIGADEVEITEILVKVGDKVEAEQSLITVEGDKASMEVPSPQAGIVKEIKVSVGDKTETGKLIMIFDSADGAAAAAPAQEEKKEAAPAAAPAAAAAAKEVNVPKWKAQHLPPLQLPRLLRHRLLHRLRLLNRLLPLL
ncbi:biotin/lipoyl-containing protein, partial [Enterobacter hormaechei]|uniref:biotin/lipoyl-containing protein n=1 Tax=Enterobacter hormaechei TaxID=158836 RepID=UPI003742DD61